MGKRKIPEFLTKQEQEQLLNVFNVRYFNSYRNKTMIQLFLVTGLRVSEMKDLKWRDINLMTGQLKVVEGKGSKDRMLYIGENTIEVLEAWREKQIENHGICEYVFTNRNKGAINERDIRRIVTDYSVKAGINKHVSPHTLRHTFATTLLSECKNIRLVQKALGHEDLSTTMIYTHIVDEEFENAMKGIKLEGAEAKGTESKKPKSKTKSVKKSVEKKKEPIEIDLEAGGVSVDPKENALRLFERRASLDEVFPAEIIKMRSEEILKIKERVEMLREEKKEKTKRVNHVKL